MDETMNPIKNTIESILGRVKKTDACWIWTGFCNKEGYGHVSMNGRLEQAHRVVYEALKGPIPDGLVLDHTCRNPSCVNPDHLEPVTQQENVLRGLKGRMKTHCPQGHPLSGDNLVPTSPTRRCKQCKAEAHARWVGRNKERLSAYMKQWKQARKAQA